MTGGGLRTTQAPTTPAARTRAVRIIHQLGLTQHMIAQRARVHKSTGTPIENREIVVRVCVGLSLVEGE